MKTFTSRLISSKSKLCLILCLAMITVLLAACTSDKKADDGEAPDLKAAYKAYAEILSENQVKIDLYEKISGPDDQFKHGHSTALSDVTGDKIPELFFFIADKDEFDEEKAHLDYENHATLKVYTFVNGKAKEVDYNFKYPFDFQNDKLVDNSNSSFPEHYVVSKGKKAGEFFIRYEVYEGGGNFFAESLCRFKISKNGDVKTAENIRIKTEFEFNGDKVSKFIYTMNDKVSDFESCQKTMKKVKKDIDEGLLYKIPVNAGSTEGLDWLLTSKDINEKASKTVSEMLAKLSANEKSTKKKASKKEAENIENAKILLPFEDTKKLSFYSGSGGWSNYLSLNKDGTFQGEFADSDLGISGEGYENGTVHICKFKGKFKNIKKIDDNTYSMELGEISLEHQEGEEWIENATKFIAATPYGIEGGETFYLWTPDKKRGELNDAQAGWLASHYYGDESGSEDVIGYFGLCNENTDDCFFEEK